MFLTVVNKRKVICKFSNNYDGKDTRRRRLSKKAQGAAGGNPMAHKVTESDLDDREYANVPLQQHSNFHSKTFRYQIN